MILIFIAFLLTHGENKELTVEIFYYQLFSTLPIILLSNLYLGLSKGGIKQIGTLTFAEDGLTVNNSKQQIHYPLKDLRNMKINLNEYKGEPTLSTRAIRLPKQGIENFLWIDKSNKSEKLRFKLDNSKHHHKLNNIIINWIGRYPMIEN